MKKYILKIFLLVFLISFSGNGFADTQQAPVTASFSMCQKTFAKPSEPFFYVVLSSISKNNYKVEEIQSRNGLILFRAYNKEFLANVTKVDFKTSLLKITPADNNYNFSYYLLENLFKTIETDLNKEIYKLN